MIAGQATPFDGKRSVQRMGKFEIVRIDWAVECEVAAVDDEIGACRIDIFAHALKIVRQLLMAAGKVGIGNLGQAKFGHAVSSRSYDKFA
jgi:hypothetical protein